MLTLLALASLPALAAPEAGGRVATNLRLALTDCGGEPGGCGLLEYGDTAVVGGWARMKVGAKSEARLALDLRLRHAVEATTLEATSEPEAVLAPSWRLVEAAVDLRGVGIPALDLVLGVQRDPWGVAEGLHVVDRVNPWDLENPLALDARLPVPMARAMLHKGQVQLEGVLVPMAWPAVLPRQGVELLPGAEALVGEGSDFGGTFEGVTINEVEARITAPPRDLAHVGAGTRLSWAAPLGDLAVSYFHGTDSLPQADGELLLTGFQTSTQRVDVAVPLTYSTVDVVGLEARGPLFADIGGWVEAAVVFPERTTARASETQLNALERLGTIDAVPEPIPAVVTQDGAPYSTWVLGLERSFGRAYLALQWLHGFPTERQRADLGDYASLGARVSLSDTVVLSASALGDPVHRGVLGTLDLHVLHGDAADLSLGAAWAQAEEGSSLYAFRGVSQVRGGVELAF